MHFVPGDSTDKDMTLWPVAPLLWWRGLNSYYACDNPLLENLNLDSANYEQSCKVLKDFGVWDAIAVDTQNGESYTLSLQDAIEVFWDYARVGKQVCEGIPLSSALHRFLIKHGVPCDYGNNPPGERLIKRLGNPLYWKFTSIIEYDAKNAYFCTELLRHIEARRYAKIRDMASSIEQTDGYLISFFPDRDFADWTPTGLVVKNAKLETIPLREWKRLASQGIRDLVACYTPNIALREHITSDGLQLVLALDGLSNAMWLAFRLHLANVFEVHPFTKTCLNDEHHHGCGKQFVPHTNRDRLCPECRATAKAASQRKWRNRNKQIGTENLQ